jgi:phosphoglycolate phosphatase-like HAD superfamily hydrolase
VILVYLFGKLLKLVILDVDGVILDFFEKFRKNFTVAAQDCGLPVEPFLAYLARVNDGSGEAHASLGEGITAFWPKISKRRAKKFAKLFREEELQNPYPPVHGSVQMLHWLKDHGVLLALCTTNEKEVLEHRLRQVRVDPSWFAAISNGNSLHQKPDPRSVDLIFKKVPVPRSEAIYVGDWFPDMRAARGAWVRFFAVLSGGVPKHAFLREGVPESHILERLVDLSRLIRATPPPQVRALP